jgi:hypothetical protein
MSEIGPLTEDQRQRLEEIGVPAERFADFIAGRPIAVVLVTESDPGVAVIRLQPSRLSCGIVEVRSPGGGVKTFLRFRSRAMRLAASLGAGELELFGAEVINTKLRDILIAHGFSEKSVDCPDELGDETMTIWARLFDMKS